MKKVIIFCLIMMFFISGCGEKKNTLSEIETSKKVKETISNLKTYKVNLKLNNSKNYIFNFEVDRKNKKIKANYTDGDKSNELFISFDNENNLLKLYSKEVSEENWNYFPLEFNEFDVKNFLDSIIEKIIDNLFNLKNLKQVSATKNNYNYEANITSEYILEVIKEELNKYNLMEEENVINFLNSFKNMKNGNIKIKFSIDKEKYYLTSISIDLSDFVIKNTSDDVTDIPDEILLTFDGFDKEFNYQEPTNTIDYINISRKSATEDSAYGLRKATELYYVTALMESPNGFSGITLTCDGSICASESGSKLEIDGVIPTSGNISIDSSGSITFSNIVINNFLCDIPSSGTIVCV